MMLRPDDTFRREQVRRMSAPRLLRRLRNLGGLMRSSELRNESPFEFQDGLPGSYVVVEGADRLAAYLAALKAASIGRDRARLLAARQRQSLRLMLSPEVVKRRALLPAAGRWAGSTAIAIAILLLLSLPGWAELIFGAIASAAGAVWAVKYFLERVLRDLESGNGKPPES